MGNDALTIIGLFVMTLLAVIGWVAYRSITPRSK